MLLYNLSLPVALFPGNLQVQLNGRSMPALGRDFPVITVSSPTPTGFSGKHRTPEVCSRHRDDKCECPKCPWCAQGQHSGSMNSAKTSRCQDHHDDRFAPTARPQCPYYHGNAPAWFCSGYQYDPGVVGPRVASNDAHLSAK